MDRDSLVFLLSGGHLDMPERIKGGLWPHEPLKLTGVLEVLADCIRSNEWFPCPWQAAERGRTVYEGGTFQRISDGQFVYRAQRAHAI